MPYFYSETWVAVDSKTVKDPNGWYTKLPISKTCRSGSINKQEVHLPLTLDEYCNTALKLESLDSRNRDQVLVKYQLEQGGTKRAVGDSLSSQDLPPHTRLLMVHQIWIDVLAKGLIVAFPECVLKDEAINAFFLSRSHFYIMRETPQGCALWTADLLSTFIGLLEQSTLSGLPEPALNIFQKSTTKIRDEVDKDFANASSEDQRALADKERELFHNISDVREELSMIGWVVYEQAEVWTELMAVLKTKFQPDTISKDEWESTVNGRMSATSRYLQKLQRRIEKLDKDAERVQALIVRLWEHLVHSRHRSGDLEYIGGATEAKAL